MLPLPPRSPCRAYAPDRTEATPKRCPPSRTLAAAAWQGAMMVCNPYQVSIGACLFMSQEQRDIFNEVKDHFDALPRAYQIMAQRDRETLESLGVW